MYKVVKISFDEYFDKIGKTNLTKLYNRYKKMFNKEELAENNKDSIIYTGILYNFEYLISMLSDVEMNSFSNLLSVNSIEEVDNSFIINNFVFVDDDVLMIPVEVINTFDKLNTLENRKKKIFKIIKFYLNINGVLSIDKLLEIIMEIGFYVNKAELKNYLKELNLKIINNYVYYNEFAVKVDKEINLINIKKKLCNYSIYNLKEIIEVEEKIDDKSYEIELYKIMKKIIPDRVKCFNMCLKIYDCIKLGYNYDEFINKEWLGLKGPRKLLVELSDLVEKIYLDIPSWEFNGFYPEEDFFGTSEEDIQHMLKYVDMYVLVNGAMEIDILFNIITKEHNFEITKDEFVCILSKTNGICVIDNFYVCIEGMDRKLLDELVILKKKIKNYKIITDLKQFKDDIDINNDKIKKLVNKYSSNKHFAKEVENVISSGQFCLNNLNVILDYFNINLPENKVNRMYKDLDNCQKNVRMFPLNGFTMNELSNKKKS